MNTCERVEIQADDSEPKRNGLRRIKKIQPWWNLVILQSTEGDIVIVRMMNSFECQIIWSDIRKKNHSSNDKECWTDIESRIVWFW